MAAPDVLAALSLTAAVDLLVRWGRSIDGTQISSRNSSAGQLRSEWCRTQSPSGSRWLACPAGRGGTGAGARVGIIVISSLALGSSRQRDAPRPRGHPPHVQCSARNSAAERGGAKLGLGRLFECHQERDGGLGVRAEGEHTVAGEQDGLGTRSFRVQRGDRAG